MKVWRHRAPSAPVESSSATGANNFSVMTDATASVQYAYHEATHCEVQHSGDIAEPPLLASICEESEHGQGPSAQAGVLTLGSICEELEQDEGQEAGADDVLICAICEDVVKKNGRGCTHNGRWHGAYEDCGVRCLQLGTNIGMQHWGCCYQVDRNSVRCPRAMHVPVNVNRSLNGSLPLVDAVEFYAEYHGHRLEHLLQLLHGLRRQGIDEFVWLAGDSTLDNKFWLFNGPHPDLFPGANGYNAEAINGYEHVLMPPRMVMDVAYQLNKSLQAKLQTRLHGSRRIAAINTSYEEGTLSDRDGEKLLPQDAFIRNHIRPEDTLVVSVGGNDVALKPSVKTALSALAMSRMASVESIEAGKATGQGHFYSLFHTATKRYIEKLIARTKPKRVIVCTLYFLDEAQTGGWADGVLGHLGYNDDPSRLQAAIRHVFETATSTIHIEGVEVIAVPLFHVLDGKTSSDYKSRVEPSVTGGEKMSRLLADAILR